MPQDEALSPWLTDLSAVYRALGMSERTTERALRYAEVRADTPASKNRHREPPPESTKFRRQADEPTARPRRLSEVSSKAKRRGREAILARR
jgi:hypothetical protein